MTYVRNAWYVADWAHKLTADRPHGVRILDEPIVIWRNAAGELTAFEDRCIHRLAPLSLGRCEGETLRCMYHGVLYDRTGQVIDIPGQDHIPKNCRLRTYPIVQRHGWVWVWMGDEAPAHDLIPSVVGLDNSDYVFGHGELDYAAEARLVNDNLLDLSHASFLHSGVSETWAREPAKVTEHDRFVRSERWIKNEGELGFVDREKVDTYFCYDFFVPGALLMTIRTYPVGTADALNGQAPDLNEPAISVGSHAITPVTDKTTRYFYVVGRRGADETEANMELA